MPCSAMGVVKKQPDVLLNRNENDIAALKKVQYSILDNAKNYVKSGGLLVYSTCTIFKEENDKLNLSAKDLGYSALVVSQFTLYGDTRKGFRPSFIKAAKPPLAVDAYELFLAEMNRQGLKEVQHGEFGADMQVSLVNEGPCTIVMDTDEWKHKE